MSSQALRYWIIIVAVLVSALVFFILTGGGSTTFNFSLSGLIAVLIIALAAYNWGGWRRS